MYGIYLEESPDIYEDVYELIEQIVELELDNNTIPKRSLTITLNTYDNVNNETKDEINMKLELLKLRFLEMNHLKRYF